MSNFSLRLTEEQRNAVRAIVRNHPGFEAHRIANGNYDSRAITKDQLMAAIVALGLEQQATAIANAPVILNTVGTVKTVSIPSPDGMEPQGIEPAPASILARDAIDNGDADAMTASVLDPIRPFLAPSILDGIATALAPIVAAAVKPPVTKEVIRTVTVDENGLPIAGAMPEPEQAKRVGKTTLGKLYGLSRFKHSGAEVSQWDSAHAPAIDPFYVAEPGVLARLVTAVERGRNVWLGGPKGSGKTTLPTQYAARTRRPMIRISGERTIETVDLIGQLIPVGNGKWRWNDGKLLRAIRTPGMVVFIDEITAIPPGLLMIVQTLIDERYIDLVTGERVRCADGVVFVVADNTFGFGDTSGVYGGTMVANAALVDRMARMIRVDYLPEALESQALANHTLCTTPSQKAACDRVVAFAVSSRKLSGLEDRPISLRQMIAFVEQVQDGFTVAEAFEDTCLTRLPDAERAILKTHFDPLFDAKAFVSELNGTPAPAPALTPERSKAQAEAQEAFDIIDQN